MDYYRKFIPGFGKAAEPLYRLINKSNKFEWSTECTSAVAELKKKLLESPVLGYPNDRDQYTLNTDASLTASEQFLHKNKELRIDLLHIQAKF